MSEIPPELYNEQAEQDYAFCDRCGFMHSVDLNHHEEDDD